MGVAFGVDSPLNISRYVPIEISGDITTGELHAMLLAVVIAKSAGIGKLLILTDSLLGISQFQSIGLRTFPEEPPIESYDYVLKHIEDEMRGSILVKVQHIRSHQRVLSIEQRLNYIADKLAVNARMEATSILNRVTGQVQAGRVYSI